MISTEFPVARLQTLSLQALQQRDQDEVAKLMSAASTSGIFSINLTDSALGREVLELLPTMYQASETYFGQPQSVKDNDMRTDQRPDQDRGYKTCDCDETYEMSYEEFQHNKIQLPTTLRRDAPQLESFSTLSQQLGTLVLQALSDGLGLKGEDRLEHQINDKARTTDTALKFVCEPSLARVSDVGDNTHTDNGLLSLLWVREWGLKIKKDADDFGSFPPPTDGTVIMHVANTLQRLTGGQLHSTLHQVTQPLDGAAPRHFIAYLVRPYTS